MIKKVLAVCASLALALGAVLGLSTAATAAGSDSPTPYTVDATGITLPAGDTFRDNGHVNINTSLPSAWNLHFESKCIDRTDYECAGKLHNDAQYIGKSFVPWSAFGLSGAFCVKWVQISHYNEHFGEGGQKPVCVNPPTEPPVVTPPTEPEPPVVIPPTHPEPPVVPPTEPEPPVTPPTDPEPPVVPPVTPVTPEMPVDEPEVPVVDLPTPPALDNPAAQPLDVIEPEVQERRAQQLAATGFEGGWIALALIALGVGSALVIRGKRTA